MSIKIVVLHVEEDIDLEKRLTYACEVCRTFDALLIGVCAISPPTMPAYLGGSPGRAAVDAQIAYTKEEARKAKATFRRLTRGANVETEWRDEDRRYIDGMTTAARYADLAIVGQTDPDTARDFTDYELPAELVFSAGCPVIVIPSAEVPTALPKRIMVAWNASREAARAVHDVMPFLTRAQSVTIVCFDDDHLPTSDDDSAPDALRTFLSRHGVEAKTESTRRRGESVAAGLLGACDEIGADMIVMGAYGHSRVRELVLGDVTHTVLRRTKIPTLMSH